MLGDARQEGAGSEGAGEILRALLLGEKSGLGPETRRDFQRTGAYHALVISGLHVGAVAFAVLFLLRLAMVPVWVRTLLGVFVVVAYAFFVGAALPVMRAAWMCTTYLLTSLVYRQRRALNVIAATALVFLFVEPRLLEDASFQMSFLAVDRPIEWAYLLPMIVSLLAVLVRFPFYRMEHRRVRKRLAGKREVDDPIFIVGHWRSGTTHLHNLLSQDPAFATVTFRHTALPWDFMNRIRLGARILEANLPENRGMDNVALSLDSPQEEEMALGNMCALCYYYCYYFPRNWRAEYRRSILFDGVSDTEIDELAQRYRYLIGKLALEAESGKRLLLKNPSSTATKAIRMMAVSRPVTPLSCFRILPATANGRHWPASNSFILWLLVSVLPSAF